MSDAMFVGAIVLCLFHRIIGMTALPQQGNIKAKNGDFAYPDELDIENFPGHNYHMHYHHHHHPDHHHEFPDDWRKFRGEIPEEDPLGRIEPNASLQIPLDYIQDINKYNVSDLLIHFVEGVEGIEDEKPLIQERFGGDEKQERGAAVIMPKEAACMPELTSVKLVTSTDPSVLYIPQCTRIERCGGCCSHALLSCQPQDKEYVNYRVIKTQYTGGKKLKLVAKEVISVERHTKCKCDCRIQAKDCNKFQEYKKSECRCACTNIDEEKKCYKSNNTKLWNPNLCVCQCRDTMQCSTGSYFDQNECKCIPLPLKRRFVENENLRYEGLPVVPLGGEE